MIVTNLVILNVAIVLIDVFTPVTQDRQGQWLSSLLALDADLYRHPWDVWNLLSYGFAHTPLGKPGGIWHVGLNMFMLWMFGRVIESRLGRMEFLLFYLAAIVFSGLAWLISQDVWLLGTDTGQLWLKDHAIPMVIGASGGVTAVFLLFVLFYPKETVYIWGLLAVPAWLIGALIIGGDLLQGLSGRAGTTAWQAHLGGAAFAFLYLKFRWNLSRLLPAHGKKWKWPRRGPKLRVHDPATDSEALDAEADRILAKLHGEGEQSLTGYERRVLEQYSRRMREKRH